MLLEALRTVTPENKEIPIFANTFYKYFRLSKLIQEINQNFEPDVTLPLVGGFSAKRLRCLFQLWISSSEICNFAPVLMVPLTILKGSLLKDCLPSREFVLSKSENRNLEGLLRMGRAAYSAILV